MGKKKDSRIVIDLLERHAEVPSSEAFRERYVSRYAGRPVGRPVAAWAEPEPIPVMVEEPPVEPTVTLDLSHPPISGDATIAVDAFGDAPVATAPVGEEAVLAAVDGEAGTISMHAVQGSFDAGAVAEPPLQALTGDGFDAGATQAFEAVVAPDVPADSDVVSPTVSFEAVQAPEDVWGAPAEPPVVEEVVAETHGTVAMGALSEEDLEGAEEGGSPDSTQGDGQSGRKKKKRRHR